MKRGKIGERGEDREGKDLESRAGGNGKGLGKVSVPYFCRCCIAFFLFCIRQPRRMSALLKQYVGAGHTLILWEQDMRLGQVESLIEWGAQG